MMDSYYLKCRKKKVKLNFFKKKNIVSLDFDSETQFELYFKVGIQVI